MEIMPGCVSDAKGAAFAHGNGSLQPLQPAPVGVAWGLLVLAGWWSRFIEVKRSGLYALYDADVSSLAAPCDWSSARTCMCVCLLHASSHAQSAPFVP